MKSTHIAYLHTGLSYKLQSLSRKSVVLHEEVKGFFIKKKKKKKINKDWAL